MISIIIPVYNGEENIGSCINSVLQQSFVDFELIIVDDGSSDRTAEIIQYYMNQDIRVRYLRNKINRGQGFSRNKGVLSSSGELLVFIDSDCIAHKDWLSKITKPILDGKADVARGINYPLKNLGFWAHLEWMWMEQSKGFDTKNVAIKKSVFNNLGGFNNNFSPAEDLELDSRIKIDNFEIYKTDAEVEHKYYNNFFKSCKKIWFKGGLIYQCFLVIYPKLKFAHYTFYSTISILKNAIVVFKKKDIRLPIDVIFIFYKAFCDVLLNMRILLFLLEKKVKNEIFDKINYIILAYPPTMLFFKKLFIIKKSNNNLGAFNTLTLFITNKCNLNCRYCFIRYSSITKERPLEFIEIKKLLLNLKFPLKNIIITGGEPFMADFIVNLCKLIDYNEVAEQISIVSNGLNSNLIYTQVNEILRNCATNIKISISLDGLQETHDKLKDKEGSFKNALDTLSKLKQLKEKYPNFSLGIITVISNDNIAEIERLILFLNQYNLKHFFNLVRSSSCNIFGIDRSLIGDLNVPGLNNNIPNFKELKEIFLKIYRLNKKLAFKLLESSQIPMASILLNTLHSRNRIISCVQGHRSFVVYSNGDVGVCEMLRPMGNLRSANYDLNNILSSKEASLFRVNTRKCACTHECAIFDSLFYQ